MTYPIATGQFSEQDDDLFDMFGDLPPIDPFEIKKDEIAVALTALMAFSGTKRTELAEKLNWKKSRITSVLSGRANPTLKTLWEFSSCLGYDFDVVFRTFAEKCPAQPWRKDPSFTISVNEPSYNRTDFFGPEIRIQTCYEVARDIANGKQQAVYVSFCSQDEPKQTVAPVIGLMPQHNLESPKITFKILHKEK